MISLIVTISVMTSTIFASVVYLSFKTYKKLNTMYCDMSPKTRQIQSGFNRMLTTQVSNLKQLQHNWLKNLSDQRYICLRCDSSSVSHLFNDYSNQRCRSWNSYKHIVCLRACNQPALHVVFGWTISTTFLVIPFCGKTHLHMLNVFVFRPIRLALAWNRHCHHKST